MLHKKIISRRFLKRIGFLVGFCLICNSCHQEEDTVVIIAAAANMQFAIKEISKRFTKKTGVPCRFVISSSGKLTAQIKEGAPYDIFVAANMKYPNEIYKSNLAVDTPKVYARGQLILWSMNHKTQTSIVDLTSKNIQHIAIANPKTAPYGQAAIEVLSHAQIYDSIIDKLVYGESIAQTNQFIVSKSVEIGITAKSVVMSPMMKGKGHWITLDSNTYGPIYQGVVLVKSKKVSKKEAKQFYDFLFSVEAQEILEDFGYLAAQ